MIHPKSIAQDRPSVVDLCLVLLVGLHFTASAVGWLPSVWHALAKADVALSSPIYLALLGPATIEGGFAGVVIIFGLESDSPRFRRFRLTAGESLKRTWSSCALSGFTAALSSGAAAVLAASGLKDLAPWFFELGILLLAHGTLRLFWILRGLIQTIHASDVEAERVAATKSVESFGFNRKAS